MCEPTSDFARELSLAQAVGNGGFVPDSVIRLTKGNPRSDQLAGQESSNAVYGRPLFGRNVRFVLTNGVIKRGVKRLASQPAGRESVVCKVHP